MYSLEQSLENSLTPSPRNISRVGSHEVDKSLLKEHNLWLRLQSLIHHSMRSQQDGDAVDEAVRLEVGGTFPGLGVWLCCCCGVIGVSWCEVNLNTVEQFL